MFPVLFASAHAVAVMIEFERRGSGEANA